PPSRWPNQRHGRIETAVRREPTDEESPRMRTQRVIDGGEESFQLRRSIEDVGGEADPAWAAGDADPPRGALGAGRLQVPARGPEAHQSAVERVRFGCYQAECGTVPCAEGSGEALAQAPGQRMDPVVDAFRSNRLDEIERRLQAHHHGEIGRTQVRE